jgi:hypothetical protein
MKRHTSLKNMEPMSGFEPLTYALRMRRLGFWQAIERQLVAVLAGVYGKRFESTTIRLVHDNPFRSDW